MSTRLRIKLTRNGLLMLPIILLMALIALAVILVFSKIDSEQTITSGANITELIDVDDIKKRMKFHGCLVCWKNPDGVWWFDRDGKNCKLW